MAGSAPRDLRITYNGVNVGGSDQTHYLTGHYRVTQHHEDASCEFDVVVIGSSSGSFASNCRDFESKMSTPWDEIRITQGGADLLTAKQSDSTGMDISPTVVKVGDERVDSGLSRLYRVTLRWGRPADYNTQSLGLRSSDVDVSTDESGILTIAIVGTYTALDGVAARAQYEAQIDAFQDAVVTAVSGSGTFEKISETATENTNATLLSFRRVLREVVYDQAGGGKANAAITSQVLTITPKRMVIERHPSLAARPLSEITASYSASVDVTEETDLENVWEDVRDFIIGEAENFFDGPAIIRSEAPQYSPDSNRIGATMVFAGVEDDDYLAARVVTADQLSAGREMPHAWTGSAWTKYLFQGGSTYLRTIQISVVMKGDKDVGAAESLITQALGFNKAVPAQVGTHDGHDLGSAPATWVTLSKRMSADPYQLGEFDTTETFTAITAEIVQALYNDARDVTVGTS